jgi:NAD-dependent oxidoreductase involved in siderophore biosynthesis
MGKLRVGVVGVGHLGKEHARILAGLPDVELVGVADVNPEQARAVAGRCGTAAFSDYRALLGGLDAAVVAVPTTHHHAVASHCLKHGIALLVEKPLTVTATEADDWWTSRRGTASCCRWGTSSASTRRSRSCSATGCGRAWSAASGSARSPAGPPTSGRCST